MIKFINVNKWYHNNTLKALENINIEIPAGELFSFTVTVVQARLPFFN